MPLASLSLMSVVGFAATLWLVAPMLWLRRLHAGLLTGGSLITSPLLLNFAFVAGLLRLPVLCHPSLFGPPAGLMHWIGPLLLPLGLCGMFGISTGRSLRLCLASLFLLLGMSMIGLMLMDSGSPGAKVLRRASFVLIAGRVVRLPLGSMLSLVGVRFVSVGVVWAADL